MGENAGVGDRIPRPIKSMVGMTAPRIDLFAINNSRRGCIISLGPTWDFTHMAILTGFPFRMRWRVTILVPDYLKFNTKVYSDLMARDTKF